MRSSETRKGLAVCRAKAAPSFLSCFKTLSSLRASFPGRSGGGRQKGRGACGQARPSVLARPQESSPRPPALQSGALPTELLKSFRFEDANEY